jgi:transposase-like protein
VAALITDMPVSAQTVSRLTWDPDQAVTPSFIRRDLTDDGRYLFLDGVSLQVRRPSGTRLLQDLLELLAFFQCPRALWRKLRTTNVIERYFVEVRRRTRSMVCFVNVQSEERIIYSIFNRFTLQWRQRTLRHYTSHVNSPCTAFP